MPKDVKPSAAKERVKASLEAKKAKFEEYIGRLPEGTSLAMLDPYAKSRPQRPKSETALAAERADVQRQMERNQRLREVEAAQKQRRADEKTFGDLATGVAGISGLGSTELGPPIGEDRFRDTVEKTTGKPYEEVLRGEGRKRKSRKSKKSKKGGRKTRKSGKSRRH